MDAEDRRIYHGRIFRTPSNVATRQTFDNDWDYANNIFYSLKVGRVVVCFKLEGIAHHDVLIPV